MKRLRPASSVWVRQVAIDLVSGDVMKNGTPACVDWLILANNYEPLKQGIGAKDVGFDKGCRAVDRTVYVALGRQVHDGIRLVLSQCRSSSTRLQISIWSKASRRCFR